MTPDAPGRATAAPDYADMVLRPGGHTWSSVTHRHIARREPAEGSDLRGSNRALNVKTRL